MKKRIVWLAAAAMAFGLYAPAEVVITSPTGLPDESDVALESAVRAVKGAPADTVEAVGGAVSFTGDELRNTAHGIAAPFKGQPRETVRRSMLGDVTGSWDPSGDIIMRTYAVSPAVGKELTPAAAETGTAVDVRDFFQGIEFPKGATAYYRPGSRRLVAFNTDANLCAIEDVLARHHHAERDYKQVAIKAKFIEVSQSTLNQLGFTWRIEDDPAASGVHLTGHWNILDNRDIFSAGLRTAAGAFGGTPGAGSMVLTKTGWMPLSVAISALEQATDSDVLSAPSLTTMDGEKAEIWVGEDRQVPQSFSVGSDDVNIHIVHGDWDSELMGVYFVVTPEIQKNDLIRLSLNPRIIDLIGYDSYEVCPASDMLILAGNYNRTGGNYPILKYLPDGTISDVWQAMQASLGAVLYDNGTGTVTNHIDPNASDPNDPDTWSWPQSGTPPTPGSGYHENNRTMDHETFGIPLAAIDGHLPYFRMREIKTQVDVADGSTVGLGGLIYDRLETYKDKVPVLGSIPLIGRLFRSEGERSIKRNLMIFVTAGQVDNNGQMKSGVALNN